MYASPNTSERRKLWGKLDRNNVKGPWALIGDFNFVLKAKERSSDSGVSLGFQEWVERTGLFDFGYSGPKYTWNFGVSTQTRKEARLDRAL